MTHYLFDEFVRCKIKLTDEELLHNTTDDFLMVSCPECARLLIRDCAPPALKYRYGEDNS